MRSRWQADSDRDYAHRHHRHASAFVAASGWKPSQFCEELVERYVKAELKKT